MDDFDALFDFDVDMDDDAFQNPNGAKAGTSRQDPASRRHEDGSETGLGIDEEVKIAKARKPVAKLDETRLLTPAGIPKLRRIAKTRVKFRGKGHEFSDVARLLNTYQLWLDDLYPRAKFADGLAIIEKLGHSKRMQMMRKQWIDEGKPRENTEQEADEEPTPDAVEPSATSPAAASKRNNTIDMPDGMGAQDGGNESTQIQEGQSSRPGEDAHEPDDDELDALLAQESMHDTRPSTSLFGTGAAQMPTRKPEPPPVDDDDFADDLEAMAGLDDDW
ncbi:Swi3-domain-containing protein [Aulographum hederae CBS 113979]|uniref:Chromosome segregation in meiosis protein n=1 Tax=Aulographum hederae CBS 113979 TaxID=1176131 RepID=A0A6G1H173_9PEZI|nr:Swi3-domain-containing protein [Aulographum hederae CBS 113979]